VSDAVLDAAAELLADRGPSAVSLREIAARAGVNYGLVHRHFGTKDALVRAVMAREAGALADALAASNRRRTPAVAAMQRHDRHWRILARAALDGTDLTTLQADYPSIRPLVDHLVARSDAGTELDARMAGAAIAAMNLGWVLFEPFLVDAAGLSRTSAATRAAVLDELSARLGAP
jgi:AcrR family transcriptional regulator